MSLREKQKERQSVPTAPLRPSRDATREQDLGKEAACRRALDDFVRPGMHIGLGSGSTSAQFVHQLAERCLAGLEITAVTSARSIEALALAQRIPLLPLDDRRPLDLAIDGADAIDQQWRILKGGGGCLLWEKIMSRAAPQLLILCDSSKLVASLDASTIPVEIVPFGWPVTRRLVEDLLTRLGADPQPSSLRRGEGGQLFITDGGHYLLDCPCARLTEISAIARELPTIPGVIESGLFLTEASFVIVGYGDGRSEVRRRPNSAPAGKRWRKRLLCPF